MSTTRWLGAAPAIDGKTPLTHRLDRVFGSAQDGQAGDALPGSCCFADAQALTVRVRGVSVVGSYEWRPNDKPDLMVVTVHNFGSEPLATRLHFMQDNVDLGWHGDFFEDTVVAMRDYKIDDKRRLTLRIQIYDMDRFDAELVTDVTKVASSVAVTFPALAPYAAAVGFGAPALTKLIENIEQHDRIIDDRIILEVSAPSTGHNLLQPGYFVCFATPVEEERNLFLTSNLRVVQANENSPAGSAPFTECSYAVIEVQQEFNAGREWELDQKINKLISELNGKGQSGRAALDFLRETMDLYDRYKRLERARALSARQEKEPDTLTDAEHKLLEELQRDANLAPYLPNQTNS
jgi:hypothetical protein